MNAPHGSDVDLRSAAPDVNGSQLVRTLVPGPVDIVGDVHGEIDALRALVALLGYAEDGGHREGRRLVFVGDLIDRGPDSPAVVRWVTDLIARGRAQGVMGNHDLNAVLDHRKSENGWVLGKSPTNGAERIVVGEEREEILALLRGLPLALERPDLRVVHACWDDWAIELVRQSGDVVQLYKTYATLIAEATAGVADQIEKNLRKQNDNPVKIITSGPEHRSKAPFRAGGKDRNEARTSWWNHYTAGPVCVFGHYSRMPEPDADQNDGVFGDAPLYATLGSGRAICIDYSVGARAKERRAGLSNGSHIGLLGALRWPERELVFDSGEMRPLECAAMTR